MRSPRPTLPFFAVLLLPTCDAFRAGTLRPSVSQAAALHQPRLTEVVRVRAADATMASPSVVALSGLAVILKLSWRGAVIAATGAVAAKSLQVDFSEWPPLPIAGVIASIATLSVVRPMLVAQVLYVAWGVGLGYGATKFLRWAWTLESPRARIRQAIGDRVGAAAATLNVRAKLRAALLKFDPSLEERQDETIGFGDLMPLRRKEQQKKVETEEKVEEGVRTARTGARWACLPSKALLSPPSHPSPRRRPARRRLVRPSKVLWILPRGPASALGTASNGAARTEVGQQRATCVVGSHRCVLWPVGSSMLGEIRCTLASPVECSSTKMVSQSSAQASWVTRWRLLRFSTIFSTTGISQSRCRSREQVGEREGGAPQRQSLPPAPASFARKVRFGVIHM